MPEYPEVTLYVERLQALVAGQVLEGVRLINPFVLRTVAPPLTDLAGRTLERVERLGKRIVLTFSGERYVVIHLMIAGRLRWARKGAGLARKVGLAAFDFAHGTLLLTEAGTKRRAAMHVVAGRAGLEAFRRGGVDPMAASPEAFAAALRRQNRTLKRALTDPDIVDGIGNAYSDEILHRARLSPFKQTEALTPAECAALLTACQEVLGEWVARLRAEAGDGFLEKVTAFHPEMAVHGKYRAPCPVCGAPVQRLVYAENEANYCPGCQTGGKVFADRALSRLLREDWPKRVEELEERAIATTRKPG
ncbi:MAG TPA: DNA-formamidopyrimidine glycosylase family protein [Limnochordia bacterium]|nr:DNA-formamidopyrimidine glycosylase family protein [Limnochordia bacterium]